MYICDYKNLDVCACVLKVLRQELSLAISLGLDLPDMDLRLSDDTSVCSDQGGGSLPPMLVSRVHVCPFCANQSN